MSGTQQQTVATQVEQQRLGYNGISLTEWATSAAAQIASGSKVEVAGSLFYFDSDDTIEDWSTIATSNTAYIKLVSSGTTITGYWVSAAPVWRDDKQGWYATAASNDRVIGGAYKSGTNSYEGKFLYQGYSFTDSEDIRFTTDYDTMIDFATVQDRDRKIQFASDANITWDESEDYFQFDKQIYSDGGRKPINSIHDASITSGSVYSAINTVIPTTGNNIVMHGAFTADGTFSQVSRAEKAASGQIYLYYAVSSGVGFFNALQGGTATMSVSFSW